MLPKLGIPGAATQENRHGEAYSAQAHTKSQCMGRGTWLWGNMSGLHLLNGFHTNPPSCGNVPHHLLKEQHRGWGLGLYRKSLLQGLLQQVLVEL